jgi:hypothetical protein
MLAQWSSRDRLRAQLRKRLLDTMMEGSLSLMCAHSLGSLVCYEERRLAGAAPHKSLTASREKA